MYCFFLILREIGGFWDGYGIGVLCGIIVRDIFYYGYYDW